MENGKIQSRWRVYTCSLYYQFFYMLKVIIIKLEKYIESVTVVPGRVQWEELWCITEVMGIFLEPGFLQSPVQRKKLF